VAGLAGMVSGSRRDPTRHPGAEVVENIETAGRELFQPTGEPGESAERLLGATTETAGQAIKYPLSAVPFALGGTEEREEFMEMPMGQYLGELAQDNGASPLFATLAHIAPDAVLMAAGGKGIGKSTAPKTPVTPKPRVPTMEQLKADSTALYKVVDDAGITIKADAFESAVGKIMDDFFAEGGRQGLTPKTYAALQELRAESAAGGVTLSKLDELRKVLGKARSSSEAADRASANRAIHAIDRFAENFNRGQLTQTAEGAATGVSMTEGAEYAKSARSLWARARKTEAMEDMIEVAGINAKTYSGAGFENALRNEFKILARKLVKDKRTRAMYTPAEQAAIKAVAMGEPISNLLRALGKAAPTGIVSGALGSGAGFVIGGPVGAIGVPAVGSLARLFATRMSLAKAKEAKDLMAVGPP